MNRFASLLLCVSVFLVPSGCSDVDITEVHLRNGALELNPRLRGDLEASAGMVNGRFFSDGTCFSGAGPGDECHFVSPVRGSAVAPPMLQRLRRAPFLWLSNAGFPIVSYELIARNIDVLSADDPSQVLAHGVTVGTCLRFPINNPETRQPVAGLESFDRSNYPTIGENFEVKVHECASRDIAGVSETLEAQTANCSDFSVRDLIDPARHSAPELPPVCLVNVGVGGQPTDTSHTLTLEISQALQDSWPDRTVQPLGLLPHLKTVPVGGMRTISRPLMRQVPAPGEHEFQYHWQLGVDGEQWPENFSPEIMVSHARVRHGPPGNPSTYVSLSALEVANVRCRTHNADSTEFDIPMCRAAPGEPAGPMLRVTPAYTFDTISNGRVDDQDRVLWDARVLVPEGQQPPDDLFLELDLTAMSPTGTSGGALTASPPARDLGSIRTHTPPAPMPGHTLRNLGGMSVWIDSIVLEGRNAAEFAVQAHRAVASLTSGPLPTLATPFILPAQSSIDIDVLPNFQTAGEKQARVAITFHDLTSQTIRTALNANAISAVVGVLPQQLYFYASPSVPGPAHVEHAMLIENDGSASFERRTVSITGPNAADFYVVSSGLGPTRPPASQPVIIQSGWSEVHRIAFAPNATGVRTATLRLETSEGVYTVPLNGRCDERCQQPARPIIGTANKFKFPDAVNLRLERAQRRR
jgi:hypothetical protein